MRIFPTYATFIQIGTKRRFVVTMPTPRELKASFPCNAYPFIEQNRKQLARAISGEEKQWCIVLGPCSLHSQDSALEYALRLQRLQQEVGTTCLLVMRAYIEKPRTFLGWKGLLYDPYLNDQEDLLEGLILSRKLLAKLSNLVPLATEFLDPLAAPYFSDLISWGFIGARTVLSQSHRQLASSLPMPIGFKNSLDGHLESAIHGALVARKPQNLLRIDEEGRVNVHAGSGNPDTHIVLRGSQSKPNYDALHVEKARRLSLLHGLSAKILIDCSHGNSKRDHKKQMEVFSSIVAQHTEQDKDILGVMLESHLEEGSQALHPRALSSISVTDPCLGWTSTKELIYQFVDAFSCLSPS